MKPTAVMVNTNEFQALCNNFPNIEFKLLQKKPGEMTLLFKIKDKQFTRRIKYNTFKELVSVFIGIENAIKKKKTK